MEEITGQVSVEETPRSLDEVIAGLCGFGIEENEEILTLKAGGKKHTLRLSNIPTEAELQAIMAVEDVKGYPWLQRIKAEVLSRSISYIDGISLRSLPPEKLYVTNPVTKEQTTFQVALRDIILGWGQEVMTVLWKVFMVHSQRIEDRLRESFPDTAIMTDVEKRFIEMAVDDIEEQTKQLILDNAKKIVGDEENSTKTE